MSKNNSFYVHAMWDPEISRWFTHSDISGAHFETDTLQEFIDAMEEFVPDLVGEQPRVSAILTTAKWSSRRSPR